MALDDMARVIAAVMTLAHSAFVTFDLFSEGVFAAGKYDTHCGGCAALVVVFWLSIE